MLRSDVAKTGRSLHQLAMAHLRRQLSVVAWGRNTSGQVGQGMSAVHDEPAILSQLEGASVTCIGAGRHHSMAVIGSHEGGVVFSWGCGSGGKLGHGDSQDQNQPSRIEALVGQADIQRVALGHEHTLFLDSQGAVYSCGENWQGQCGHGTPLQAIAEEQRREWDRSTHSNLAGPSSHSPPSISGPGQGLYGSPQAQAWSTPQQNQRMAWARVMQPHTIQNDREAQIEAAKRLLAHGGNSLKIKDAGRYPEDFLKRNATPTPIGRSLDDVVSDMPSTSGIGEEEVISIAASKFFSAVSTKQGRVLTFGGGFSGELGNERSWETSASSVQGAVLQALQAEGGASTVEAGSTFCMALTHSGSVVVWGSLPGSPETRQRGPSSSRVVRIRDVPLMKHIAAGYSHAAMSDGRRVWVMGRWLDPNGMMQTTGAWGKPDVVLESEDEIVDLQAGPHSMAAVTSEGDLFLWGKLLSEDDIRMLRKKHGRPHFGAPGGSLWEGLGSSKPTRLSGLGRVRKIALGYQHALAVVE